MTNLDEANYAGDVGPCTAWSQLDDDPDAVLIDVRTSAEWQYVGLPDLTLLNKQVVQISWQNFPDMDVNSNFVDRLAQVGLRPTQSLFFLCRSGVRSKHAAIATTLAGFERCLNILGGFEGDADVHGHRGTLSGWKATGLAWRQN